MAMQTRMIASGERVYRLVGKTEMEADTLSII